MRKVVFGLVLLLVCMSIVGVCIADVPDFIGTWSGSAVADHEERGIIEGPDNSIIMNVTEQNDRIFSGEIQILNKDGTYRSEKFAGIIELGGTEFKIIEFDKGFSLGDILGPDEIELIYLENTEGEGPAIVSSNHLFRNST